MKDLLALSILSLVLVGCTTEPTTTSDQVSPSPTPCRLGEAGCQVEVETRGTIYAVACQPVPEALVDVDLPKQPGTPRLKAIAGVARSQGIAVLWDEPAGCGLWALALAKGLTPETDTAIRDEVARGVERFGVTASPLPDDGTGEDGS